MAALKLPDGEDINTLMILCVSVLFKNPKEEDVYCLTLSRQVQYIIRESELPRQIIIDILNA